MNKRATNHFFKKCVTFSELSIPEGGNTSRVQILKTGTWNHPVYGTFSVTTADLDEFIFNFQTNARGVDLCVDVNHDPEHKAIGWFREVFREGEALFANIEWNDEGLYQINSKAFRYFSPELFFSYRDEENGKDMKNVLLGGGITNRPFFKGMQALKMSEASTVTDEASPILYFFNTQNMKKKFSEIFAELNALEKVGPAALEEAKVAFSELSEEDQTTEKVNLETLEAKPVEEAPVDPVTPPAEGEAAPADVTPPTDTPPADAPLQASEQVETAVFKETGLNLAQIKEMQKKFSEMEKAQKFAETEKKVDSFIFSESNKDGVILPKAKGKIAEFASKLPDAMANEFFEILGSKSFKTMEFKEIGQDGNGNGGSQSFEFSVPTETPAGVSRESFVLDFVAKEFQTKEKGLKFEEAMFKALKAIEENGIK